MGLRIGLLGDLNSYSYLPRMVPNTWKVCFLERCGLWAESLLGYPMVLSDYPAFISRIQIILQLVHWLRWRTVLCLSVNCLRLWGCIHHQSSEFSISLWTPLVWYNWPCEFLRWSWETSSLVKERNVPGSNTSKTQLWPWMSCDPSEHIFVSCTL